jgi:NADH:ubiquinone oxidoreductase subunit K
MSEIMLNAVNLLFVFSTYHQDAQGQILSFLYGCTCRVAVGLAILVSIFRNLG